MPGGLLDMFGIDPVANRQTRQKDAMLERQIAGELARQRLANQGQRDVTTLQGKNNITLEQWKALAEHAKTLGISPDNIAELKPKRLEIDNKTLDMRSTDASVANVQSKSRGSMYGVNDAPAGVNPDIAEGLRRSNVAEAVNPANAAAKANALDITRPQLQPDPSNPLSFGVTPYLQENKTGSYFDTATGRMVPDQSTTSLQPGQPILTDYDVRQKRAQFEAAKAAAAGGIPGAQNVATDPIIGMMKRLRRVGQVPQGASVAPSSPQGLIPQIARGTKHYYWDEPNRWLNANIGEPLLKTLWTGEQ